MPEINQGKAMDKNTSSDPKGSEITTDESAPIGEPQKGFETSQKSNRSKKKLWLGVTILAVALALAAVGTCHYLGDKHTKSANVYTEASKTQASSQPDKAKAIENFSSDVALGYPISAPRTKVFATLYVPIGTSLLQYSEDIKAQADLAGMYTESFNDLIARWLLSSQGTRDNPSQNTNPTDEIFISAIKDWAAADDKATVQYSSLYGSGNRRMTVAQKAEFITKLKGDSASCAEDRSKGIATNDGTLELCYTLDHPRAQGGNRVLYLSGYGEIKNLPLYIGGHIELPSDYQSDLSKYLDALEHITVMATEANTNP